MALPVAGITALTEEGFFSPPISGQAGKNQWERKWGTVNLPVFCGDPWTCLSMDDPKASPVVYLEGVQNTKSCRVPHCGTHTPLAVRAVLGGGGNKMEVEGRQTPFDI